MLSGEGRSLDMKNVLITGGTVFVSRFGAEYYVKKGYRVLS